LITIIEACCSRGVDAKTCLRDALTRLPKLTNRQIDELTPAAGVKTQDKTAQHQAA